MSVFNETPISARFIADTYITPIKESDDSDYHLTGHYWVTQWPDGDCGAQGLSLHLQLHTPRPTIDYYYMVWAQIYGKDDNEILGWSCTQ